MIEEYRRNNIYEQDRTHYTGKGRKYSFCSCGYLFWDDDLKCQRGHPRGYRQVVKSRKKRKSGFSPYQKSKGGFQTSSRA